MKKLISNTTLVMGATGNVGSTLLQQLMSDQEVTNSERKIVAGVHFSKGSQFIPGKLDFRICNYADAAQYRTALVGIDNLFLNIPFHKNMVEWGVDFIAEAKRQGVRYIVKLSGLDASVNCESKMGQLHGQIDLAVQHSGLEHCILRCNSFMQNYSGHYLSMLRNQGELLLSEGDGKSCFIDATDIAAVVVKVLSNPENHRNVVYNLTGPEALNNAKAVQLISTAINKPLFYKNVADHQIRERYLKLGISPWSIDVLESLSRYIRKGGASMLTQDVAVILQRPPSSFADFIKHNRHCWI